jgi:hypothetical protein
MRLVSLLFFLFWAGFAFAQVPFRPIFSAQAGFYPNWFRLDLTSLTPGGIIRYTTDGDSVTAQSAVYDPAQGIQVSHTMVVRACVYPPQGGSPSPMVTNTYLINEKTKYSVVSLSVVPRHFWDPIDGIYMPGPRVEGECNFYPYPCANFWQGWERPLYVEIFDSNRQRVVAQHASVEITGGWSKANPKKGLLLGFDHDAFGDGTVHDVALIPDKPHITTWKKLHLRPGGNGHAGNMMQQDAWLQRASKTMHSDYIAYHPAHIFLNGEYWGIYEMRERQDNHFIEYNYGIDSDSVDVLRFPSGGYYDQRPQEATAGTETAWLQTIADLMAILPESQMFYDRMAAEFDLDNYLDYFAYQTFVANNDWLGPWRNNIRTWRSHRAGSKWRYMLWDLDAAAGEQWDPNLYHPCINIIRWARSPDAVSWAQSEHSELFNRFLKNPRGRVQFANRYADLLNSVMRPDSLLAFQTDIMDELRPEINRSFIKWGGDMNRWESRGQFNKKWLNDRMGCIRRHIVDECRLNKAVILTFEVEPAGAGAIRVNTLGPFDSRWTGVYFDGAPIQVSVKPQAGWTFLGWGASGDVLDAPNQMVFEHDFKKNTQLTAFFAQGDVEPLTETDPFVRIYPNPASDVALIQSKQPLGACALLDMAGRVCEEFNVFGLVYAMKVDQLQAGIYFLRTNNGTYRLAVAHPR